MYIEKLEIRGFGKISGLSLKLAKGLNIVYGRNESGKTTLQWFIKAMLFGLKGGRASKDGLPPPLKRFKPWNGGGCGGVMEYKLDSGLLFRVERDFDRNSVELYDSYFNNISGSFDVNKEKGLLFAEKHLGLNESCFEKTVLIKQMETRVDDEGSRELLSRLTNVSQSGYEDVSFKRAEKVLKEALKNYVGTDKTTTQPIDRIDARLEELDMARIRLVDKRNSLMNTESDLNEAIINRNMLQRKREYLTVIKELIACRKHIDEYNIKKSGLKDASTRHQKVEAELNSATEEFERLKGLERNSMPDTIIRKRKAAKTEWYNSIIYQTAALLFSAAVILTVYVFFKNTNGIFYAVLLFIAALMFVLYGKYLRNNQEAAKAIIENIDVTQNHEVKISEIIELNGRLKDICSGASLIYGEQIDGALRLREAFSETSEKLDDLYNRLKSGINETKGSWSNISVDFFDTGRLESIINDSSLKWLEDSWEYEMERVNQGLGDAALKLKEYETLLKGNREDDEELQKLDEEITEYKMKRNSLKETGVSLKLALDVLCEASSEIRRDLAPVLNDKMSDIINSMTDGRYVDLRADDTLILRTVSPDTGDVKNALALSGGTIDQMYLALRLAMVDLLGQAGENPPLIMDEAFSQYDDIRTVQTFKYLLKIYRNRQIIFFTCKKRELEIAREVFGEEINIVEI